MKILLGLFPILFFAFQLAAQSGTITTNILNKQTGSPNPSYKVSLYQGDEFKGSTTANEQGVAVLDNIVLTDVVYTQRINNFAISDVTPDEQTHRPSVFINSPKYTNVNYTIYTLPLAKQLSKGTIHLEYGHNQILFPEMGADGRRLIVFNGGEFAKAFKYISTNLAPINARTVSNPTNGALSKLNSVDEDVRLVFEDDGYVTHDTTLTLPTGETFNVNIDGSMERIGKETNADITTMSIIGENLADFPVHFVVGEKDSVYTSDANGLIPFKFKDFNDPYIDSMMVYIDDLEDESENDQWMGKIIVKHNDPDANMGDGEIAQNKSYNWNTHDDLYVPFDKMNQYFAVAMKFTPRFGTDAEGNTVDMKSQNIAIMSSRLATPPDYSHVRWEKYNGADTLYTIIQTNREDTKEPVSQQSLDLAIDALNHVKNLYNDQSNGLKNLNFSEIKFIENTEDSLMQYIKNDLGLQNYFLVQFRGGNAGNSSNKRDDVNIMQNATARFGDTFFNKMVSEIAAGMVGLKDGDYDVGYYFLNDATFGKIWANYRQEHATGEIFLLPP